MSYIEQAAEQFDKLIEQRSANDRLIRESAWEAFLARGLPTRRVENWRYTNLRLLNQPANEVSSDTITIDEIMGTIPEDFYRIILVDGKLRSDLSDFDAQWVNTAIAAQVNPDKHPMAVLNVAMSQGGIDIHIPAGTQVDKPILVLHINTSLSSGKTHYLNHRIKLGEGAKASVLMQYSQSEKMSCVNNILVLAQLHESSHLGYHSLNASRSESIHIEGVHAQQQAGSVLDGFVLSTGSRLSRLDLNTVYLGARSISRVYGIYSITDKQHTDIHLNAEHLAPHCTTVQSVRGVVEGSAKAVFNGRVCVHKNAEKSYSEQANHNLMLSNTAEVDTKPELEIYHDDVKCSHGATVGQLDQDALFYLMARGISKDEALALMRNAFVAQQFDYIQSENIKEYIMRVSR